MAKKSKTPMPEANPLQINIGISAGFRGLRIFWPTSGLQADNSDTRRGIA